MATVSTTEELQAWVKGDDPVTRVFPPEKLDGRRVYLTWNDKLTAKRCKVFTHKDAEVTVEISTAQWTQSEAVGGVTMGKLEATTKTEYERLITLMACYYAIKWRRKVKDDTLAKLGIDSPLIYDKKPEDLQECSDKATASPEELHKTLKILGNNQIVTAEDKATIKTSLQQLFGIPDVWARKLRTHFSKVLKKYCCTYRGLETTLALNQLTAFRGSGKVALFYGRYRARTSAQWAMLCMVWCVAKHMGEATGIDYFDKLQIPINPDKFYTLIEERAPPQETELKSAVEATLNDSDLTEVNLKEVRKTLETYFQCELKEKKAFIKQCVHDWHAKQPEPEPEREKQVVHTPAASTGGKQPDAPLKRKIETVDGSGAPSPPSKKRLDLRTKCEQFHAMLRQHQEQTLRVQKDFEALMRAFKRDQVTGF